LGTRKSFDVQNVSTIIKVDSLLSSVGVLRWIRERHATWEKFPRHSVIADGFRSVLRNRLRHDQRALAYEGWQFGTYSAGEVLTRRDVSRELPAGSLILIGLYLFAVVAYLVALGPAQAAASDDCSHWRHAQCSPLAGTCSGDDIDSTFSSTNSVMLTAARFLAMANDNLFFKKLAEVDPGSALRLRRFLPWSLVMLLASARICELASAHFIGLDFFMDSAPQASSRFVERIPESQFPIAPRAIH